VNKTLLAGGLGALAVFGAVIWFAREREPARAEAERPAAEIPAEAVAAPPPRERPSSVVPAGTVPNRPVPTDPRLAALMGAPDDSRVEYIAGADGRVIQEIDNDPASQGFRKPLREYLYAGDKVAGITVYKYLGTQVQVVRAMATYKPDGSVDAYRETTEYVKP
jgi:hypothetical protein